MNESGVTPQLMHSSSQSLVAVSFLAASFVAGCAAPDRANLQNTLVTPPDSWQSNSTVGAVVDDWWQQLGSKNLTEAIRRALAHNQDLHAAQARLAVASAQARLAGADLGPLVDASGSGARQRSVFVGFPFGGSGPLTNTYNNYGVSLNASWEIDLWGRIASAQSAALREVRASAEDLRGLRQSLAAQTAKAWFATVEARQQVALAKSTLASFTTTEAQIEDRFARGVRSALDLRLARSRRLSAEALQHQWQERAERSVRQLEVLQGVYPTGKSAVADALPSLDDPIPAGLPAALLRRRPDLAAAEHRLLAAGFRVQESLAALYPRLSLSGQIGTTSDRTKDLLDLDYLVWNALANLIAPVLDGGRRRAELDLDTAREHEAIAGFAQAALRAYGEVEALLVADRFLRLQTISLQAAEAEARVASSLSEDRYRGGLTEFVTVLDAQRNALILAGQVLAAKRQLLELRVDLHLALGGGFKINAPDSTSQEDLP